MSSIDDTAAQAFQCGDTWESEVNGNPDGLFLNLVVDGSGSLSGRHRAHGGSERDIRGGRCERLAGGSQRITITREDDDNVYVYTGDITSLGAGRFRANGTRTTTPKRRGGDEVAAAPPPPGDEEWVATRPPAV